MPRARFNRKRQVTFRRRPTRSKRYTRRRGIPRLSRGPRMQVGFPPMMMFKHRYVEPTTTLTSTTGALAEFRVAANAMYDSNLTDAGHQPMYHDQLMALYHYYHVIRSKVTFIINTPASNDAVNIGAHHDDTGSSAISATSRAETRGGKWRNVPANTDKTYRFTLYYNAAKQYGRNVLANNDLRCSNAANATELQAFVLWVQNLAGATTVFQVGYQMDYTVVYTELREISTS